MKSLDTDSSGGVSLDEFKTVGKSLPTGKFDQSDDALSKAFSSLDADGDGSLTQGEIAQGLAKFSQQSASALLGQQEVDGPPRGDHESFFDKADTDGSGSVSLDEFKAAGPKDADPTKAEEMFASIDTDGDGQISKAEDDAFRASKGGHGGPHGAGGPPPGPPPSGGADASTSSDDGDDSSSSATDDLLTQLSQLLDAKQAYGQKFSTANMDDAISSLFSASA